MNEVINAFWMTIELWAFLAILCIAMAAEGLVQKYRNQVVDNPALK